MLGSVQRKKTTKEKARKKNYKRKGELWLKVTKTTGA
jgi:hypothetical protein